MHNLVPRVKGDTVDDTEALGEPAAVCLQGLRACCELHLRCTGSHRCPHDRLEGSAGSSDP